MKFYCFLLILLLASVIPTSNSYGQDYESEDISDYFDDGGFSTSKNLLKFNVASVYVGDISIFYERAFSKRLAIEVGVGRLMSYYNKEFFGLLETPLTPEIIDPIGGYSLWVNPRVYFTDAPLHSYVGFQFRKRQYNLSNSENIMFNDYTINYGLQLDVYERVVVDYNVGVGFRFYEPKDSFPAVGGLSMPMSLKVAYLF